MQTDNRNQAYFVVACISVVLLAGFVLSNRNVQSFEKDSPTQLSEVPVGTVISWAGYVKSIPENWKVCDGRSLNKKKFPALFEAIGTYWGGDGSPKFNLPDLRGLFLRGVDAGSNRDPDVGKRIPSKAGNKPSAVGSIQDDSFQNHAHENDKHTHITKRRTGGYSHYYASGSNHIVEPHFVSTGVDNATVVIKGASRYNPVGPLKTGRETRPKNAYVFFIIKVK